MRSVIYPLRIQLDVLHRLRLRKQSQLLYDVHLIVGIDGFMELSIIWKTKETNLSEAKGGEKQITNQTVTSVFCVCIQEFLFFHLKYLTFKVMDIMVL